MNKATIIEAVAMYWPMALCATLYILLGRKSVGSKKRVLVAGMMASAWIAAVLPWVNALCMQLGYWSFHVDHDITLMGLPLSLYIGWMVLWGVLPAFLAILLERWHPFLIVGIFILLDVISMPYFSPIMLLTDSYEWLVGEVMIVVFCLVPAVYLSRWVIRDSEVGKRSALISSAFIIIILTIIPMASPVAGFNFLEVWKSFPSYVQYFYVLLFIILSLPGVAGVTEFARSGDGTPIPYDSPKRLVTSGVYMYVRNPMQLSMVLVILVWAIIFSSWLMVSVGLMAIVYSAGIARWSESIDLRGRYGDEWLSYISNVNSWRLSIFPTYVVGGNAELYIDMECRKCLEIKHWIEKRRPMALNVVPAAMWTREPLSRITYYDSHSGECSQGVLAFAKAIQHIHLGWAFLAWFISLPAISYLIQMAIDSSGAAPQTNK